jgi:hypothetical protein
MGAEDDPESGRTRPTEAAAVPSCPTRELYQQQGNEMVRREEFENGRGKLIPLANFSARIVRDLILEDGAETRREFGLEADVGGEKLAFLVSAAEFGRMGWVLRELGPQAIVYPGQQQHARAAIQYLSGAIRQERLYTHLGWRKQGGDWIYLQAGGAIAASGTVADLQVQLPTTLEHFQTPVPADRVAAKKAVRSSLDFLSVAPHRVSLPLLAAVYRAAFGAVDFSLFLAGRSGVFKTALAALCQQHFGAAMDASHLPGNFASTANALEELAFLAKDTLLVVDDFVPTGGTGDGMLEALAERLFRAAGNRQGRGRMSGLRLRDCHPPRGLLLATGEQVPRGHSLRARLLILELRSGEVDRAALTRCQVAGAEGQLAMAMGAYLAWIARDYESLQDRLRRRSRDLRGEIVETRAGSVHARVPGILAELHSGWEIWLEFARELGAVNSSEQAELERRSRQALKEVATIQSSHHQASDPARLFVSSLRAALLSGRAHVAGRRGSVPEFPERWGWRQKADRVWVPQGTRIGWLIGDDVYLEPAIGRQVACEMAGAEQLSISVHTLSRRLHQQGLLASVDTGRGMLLVRRILGGHPRTVLHLKASDLLGLATESAQKPS